MKNNTPNDLAKRFFRWRSAPKVKSISFAALKTADASDQLDTNRRLAQAARQIETIDESELSTVSRVEMQTETLPQRVGCVSYLLSPAERRQLNEELPKPQAVEISALTEPETFDTVEIEPFVPALIRDAEIEEQAAKEAALEIAQIELEADAVSFESDLNAHPIDFAPTVTAVLSFVLALVESPVSEHEALRRQFLGIP